MALMAGVRFPARMEDVFPNGCNLVPDSIAEAMDYNAQTKARTPSVDKVTGTRVWQVRVMDMDPQLVGRSREVAVKVLADHQPVPPTGAPFEQVEFEGLQITPYVGQNGRLAFSFRAMAMTEPKPLGKPKAA